MAQFTPQQIEQFLQEFFDVVGSRQYVGARYVPVFGHGGHSPIEWDGGAEAYEPLSIVYHVGTTYTSRQYVPAGVDITDTNYWVVTANYNAQVEQYRQEVLGFSDRINGAYDAVETLRNEVADDYVPFPDSDRYPKYGTTGQVLSTLADGSTKWEDPVVPSDAQAEQVITTWLNDHPEATTTVQDGAITTAKLAANAVTKPKMSLQGVPLEQYAILDLIKNLVSYVSNVPINVTFKQGTYGTSMVFDSTNTMNVSSNLMFLPKGSKVKMGASTGSGSRFLSVYKETAQMAGTYTRVGQKSIGTTGYTVMDDDYFVALTAYDSNGLTPSDVSATLIIDFSTDYLKSSISTINSELLSRYTKQISTDSTDLNDYTEVGGYTVNSNYTNVPTNIASNGMLCCFSISATRKLQLLSVGGTSPQLFFRTWGALSGAFSPWNQIYPFAEDVGDNISIKYSSTNQYAINIGKVSLKLKYTDDNATDAHLWNLFEITNNSNSTQIDAGDIIGPISISGASDFTFGVHGSATTTTFKIYADGEEVTLGSTTNITCKSLVIMMHDEGRNPDDPTEHVFDRDVTITLTKNTMHVTNAIENVSGNSVNIGSACNGGLLAAFKNLINAISTTRGIHVGPYDSSQTANTHVMSGTFVMDDCVMQAENIVGHEAASYTSELVNYTGDPGRNKLYFYTMKSGTMADGDVLYGEFEYTFK